MILWNYPTMIKTFKDLKIGDILYKTEDTNEEHCSGGIIVSVKKFIIKDIKNTRKGKLIICENIKIEVGKLCYDDYVISFSCCSDIYSDKQKLLDLLEEEKESIIKNHNDMINEINN